MTDNAVIVLADQDVDQISGGIVPVAFWVGMVFLGSANLGYNIGRDVAKR